ncbi:hypothetical protein AU074_13715 [Pseudomonas sp. ATCC PTA-122608]|uniref:hypothetical protein n=1 Tax=Pseudomonas sp. ATCC PTA-122608 TaxID=1771311 RepID=UPI00096B9E62|nr:hypothetical protein [Pseudomonas sp. ATCC PTA-122608]OLY72227.1 hypothetical protein AU074_13715 [Pseudomonas sp. ATCC PTA-122608]
MNQFAVIFISLKTRIVSTQKSSRWIQREAPLKVHVRRVILNRNRTALDSLDGCHTFSHSRHRFIQPRVRTNTDSRENHTRIFKSTRTLLKQGKVQFTSMARKPIVQKRMT